MRTIGEKLRTGLLAQARGAGIEVTYSGPPALPYMTFNADAGHYDRARLFCGECSRSGVYFAPRHNWFISAAHTERDIEQTLTVTERAFAAVRKQFSA
jgi:glutamate-1-semialdehyde 2,1-aminomutase